MDPLLVKIKNFLIDLYTNKKNLQDYDSLKKNNYKFSLNYDMFTNNLENIITPENFGNDYFNLQHDLINMILKTSCDKDIKSMENYLTSEFEFFHKKNLNILSQQSKNQIERFIDIYYFKFVLDKEEYDQIKSCSTDFINICLDLYLDFSFYKFMCLFEIDKFSDKDRENIEKTLRINNTTNSFSCNRIDKQLHLNKRKLRMLRNDPFSQKDKIELYELFYELNENYDIETLFKEIKKDTKNILQKRQNNRKF